MMTARPTAAADDTILDHSYDDAIVQHLELFHYSETVQVIGPSRFPAPTEIAKQRTWLSSEDDDEDDGTIVPYLQPIAGKHRPSVDVVVAFAAEYSLSNYVTFIESLRATGFTGDVVLAISPLDQRKKDVWEYLTEPNNHVVLYAPVLVCYNAEGEQVDSAKGGSRVCKADHLFAKQHSRTGTITPIPDPRPPRTVQTLRYEIYWLMVAFHTDPHAWILLVDARDTIFQTNPFASVPRRRRRKPVSSSSQTTTNLDSGMLYFFGENVDATRLGRSASNRKWLQAAYGTYVATILADKPTVCSGATMGEQIALETYVRAIVAESDHTGTVLAGADQGFHNFLHYSHKLKNADAIDTIVVFDQGQGIVNNMGALRTKSLAEWGNGKIVRIQENPRESNPRKKKRYTVLNWDGTVSPVVHQFDRHPELSDYFFKVLGGQYMEEWNARKQKIQIDTQR
jgi:hypothetical protein